VGLADRSIDDQERLEDLRAALGRAQRQLARERNKTEALVAATIQAAQDATLAQGPVPAVPAPARDSRKIRAEHALWHLTDWQGAKHTPSYNSEVMRARVEQFCKTAERITAIQRADHPVKHCTVLLGGDMVEGLFNFPTQPFEIDATLFTQFVTVGRLLVDVVRRALAMYEHVTVVAEWGNHGRIGSKRSAVPRSDNFDRMTYELARSLLEGEPRVTWQDCPEDIQRVQIGEYRALLIHGDEIGRNGFASPSTIVNHCSRWQSGSYPWTFRDVYVGHYHQHQEWALPSGSGSVFMSGSTESDNRYAGVMLAASAQPSQRLHFVDPKRGRVTAQYKVMLD
jgi:hypothetical protein